MEKKEELIMRLAQMLLNNGTKSSVSKLPEKKQVEDTIKNNITPVNKTELLVYLNNRLECACIDTSKANGYFFMPYSENQWKVFVFDCDNKPYVQLDDYNDVISVNGTNYNKPFVVKR